MSKLNILKTMLVIDDDHNFCQAIEENLSSSSLAVLYKHTAGDAIQLCRTRKIDLVLLDENLPDGQGHTFCSAILETNEQCKIIFITAFPSFDHALKAIKAGAFDYISKPFEFQELQLAIKNALNVLELEKVQLWQSYQTKKNQEAAILIGTFGSGSAIQQLVKKAAEVHSSVLITGETGTGKNIVAHVIHYSSHCREAPFVSLNCATLPENLIEAELFGHEKGAFTGAISTRKGMFELAEGGTLFLDEIGAMPIQLQSKLLGVLDDGQIRRLGGQSQLQVNVRIIAATNANLESMIRNHSFREDLYYRLSVLCMHLPPLRERPQDIVEFCKHYIKKFSGSDDIHLPETEMQQLLNYNWPGNVRELRNILERSLILNKNDLRPSLLIHLGNQEQKNNISDSIESIPKTLEQVSRDYILQILHQQGGNLSRTAKILDISLSTLKRKLKQGQLT